MGQVERNIAQQAYRSGEPMPERISNAPELRLGLSFFLTAFLELDTERNHSNGYVQIPWSKMLLYANTYELDDEEREDFFYLIRQLDSAHISRLDKKGSTNGNASKSSGKPAEEGQRTTGGS